MHDFIQLMQFAWEECVHDISDAIRLYVGMVVGGFIILLLFLYNYGAYWIPYLTEAELTSVGLVAVLMSLLYAYVGAFILVTQLIIWVILFEYAYAFTKVCYHYDEGNWAFVRVPKMIPSAIRGLFVKHILPVFNKTKDENLQKSRFLAERIRSFKNKEEL